MDPIQIQRTTEISVVDRLGQAIHPGSVLETIPHPGIRQSRGVVEHVIKEGDRVFDMPAVEPGDLVIRTGPGTVRVTNCYSEWRHVSPSDQTYRERWQAFLLKGGHDYDPNEARFRDEGEAEACAAIVAILPPDSIDWEEGPWPDDLESTIAFLINHLEELNERQTP